MSEEIKEILERIKIYPEKLYCLSEKEKRILLDYIANLQQKVEQLENIRKEAIEYNYKLQENYSHGALFEDKIAVNVYKVAEENLNILNKGTNHLSK